MFLKDIITQACYGDLASRVLGPIMESMDHKSRPQMIIQARTLKDVPMIKLRVYLHQELIRSALGKNDDWEILLRFPTGKDAEVLLKKHQAFYLQGLSIVEDEVAQGIQDSQIQENIECDYMWTQKALQDLLGTAEVIFD